MIKQFQEIKILEKSVLQRVFFKPPLKGRQDMKNDACFIYSLEGAATIVTENEQKQLQANQGVLMQCGRYINVWHLNEKAQLNEVVLMHFYPEVLSYVYEDNIPSFLTQDNTKSTSRLQIIKYEKALENYVQGLRFYFDNPDLMDENLTKIKLKELIHLLYSCENYPVKILLKDLFEKQKSTFKEVINRHLFENLTVEELAFLTHLSLSSFKRKFKEIYQTTPAKYIKTKRLEKAAELLKYSSKSITEISFDCGFGDSKVFAKVFKIQFDTSPSLFRKKHLEQN